MISTTWTTAPAGPLGLGSLDVRPAYGPGLFGFAARAGSPTATAQGTGLPAVGTGVRVRPGARQVIGQVIGQDVRSTSLQNNGTTLGIHSSRRPQS
jgi:hypothetical protein